jgi:DNA-binding NtrC family response regulator
VTGVLTLVVEPGSEGTGSVGILVRESPRLAARAVLFLEELCHVAGIAFTTLLGQDGEPIPTARPTNEAAAAPVPATEASPAEIVLRSTDDLKKIIDTVEREVIDRAMRRVEGNQSRGAQILNISRGSLIAKLKEFGVADYRYLRRERGRRN